MPLYIQDSELGVPSNVSVLYRQMNAPVLFEVVMSENVQKNVIMISNIHFSHVYAFENEFGKRHRIKILPLRCQSIIFRKGILNIEDIAVEIVSHLYLSALGIGLNFKTPNFPTFLSWNIVEDSYPLPLFNAWMDYMKKEKLRYYQACPMARKHFNFLGLTMPNIYDKAQQFLILTTEEYGEVTAPPQVLKDAWHGVNIIVQIAFSLAIAEKLFQFEHRDLHLENLHFQKNDVDLEYVFDRRKYILPTCGFKVCISGFSFSRLSYDNAVYFSLMKDYEVDDEACCKWSDISYIRQKIVQHCKTDWSSFRPFTNILCLRHVLENFDDLLRKYNPVAQKLMCGPEDSSQKKAFGILDKWKKTVLGFDCAQGFVEQNILKCEKDFFKAL